MDNVLIPRAFAEELLEYFYAQLPMKQGEIPVNVLRQALNPPEQSGQSKTVRSILEASVQSTE